MIDKPRRVPGEGDDNEGSIESLAKFSERFIELEQQLLAMRTAQTERVRHIAWLTDELVQNSAVLEQAGANVAAGAKKCAGLEQRGQSVTNCYCLAMSRDQALEQAQSALRTTSRAAGADERSRRELAEMHAKLEARVSEFVAVRL